MRLGKRISAVIMLLMFMSAVFAFSFATAEFSLPSDLVEIEREAFRNTQLPETLKLPDTLKIIGEKAFTGCTGLKHLYVPVSVTTIGTGAIPSGITIHCARGSYAESWAKNNSYTIEYTTCYYALVIGQDYADTSVPLAGCITDADAVTNMLKTMSATPFKITTAKNLSASGILSKISTAFAQATTGDVCLFYYSGHGDEYTGDLVGNNLDSFVTVQELKAALDKYSADKIVILDSCFSGNMITSNNESEASASTPEEINAHIVDVFSEGPVANSLGGSYYVLTACRDDEYSYQLGRKVSYGAFTRYLLLGSGYDEYNMNETGTLAADTNADSAISLAEGYSYAYQKVIAVLSSSPYEQHVQCYPSNSKYTLWRK